MQGRAFPRRELPFLKQPNKANSVQTPTLEFTSIGEMATAHHNSLGVFSYGDVSHIKRTGLTYST